MVARTKKVSISFDLEQLAWIDKQITEKVFANRSHAVAYAIEQLIKRKTAS